MKELIYIEDDSYKAISVVSESLGNESWTIAGFSVENLKKYLPEFLMGTSAAATAATAARTGLGVFSMTSPVSLVLAVAVTSGPMIYKLFNTDGEPDLTDAEKKYIAESVEKIKVGRNEAKEMGYRFPPGHPVVGNLYQRHPLAAENSSKRNVFIPEENYQEFLLEERQAELVRLLIDLGATKIEIVESDDESLKNSNHLNAGVSADTGQVDVSANGSLARENSSRNLSNKTRRFELKERSSESDEFIDASLYNWLDHEPQWRSLVYAREVGGCTSAVIEMQEDRSLISSSEFAASVKVRMLSLEGKGDARSQYMNNNIYTINIEFSHPKAT